MAYQGVRITFARLFVFWILLFGAAAGSGAASEGEQSAGTRYLDPSLPVEVRVQDVLSQLTLEEKVSLLSGETHGELAGFSTHSIPRLGIPAIKMNDGPLGVRFSQATSFPSAISLGATFNPVLVGQVAKAIAEETRGFGHDMLLGPCIGISRHPFGGRNFESYGEDPYLTSQMATYYVQGLQGQGVIGSTKHFALNDQEFHRTTINTIADERTMQEIHLPAFQAAVRAGTWSVMASYNLLNGLHASENPDLLTRILKKDWGFQGFVVSDWEATHSTVPAALAGLDLEMPTGVFFGDDLLKVVQAQEVSVSLIDDKVTRILRAIFGSGLFDRGAVDGPNPALIGNAEHLSVAEKAAGEGLVLLKNENRVLPLQLLSTESRKIQTLAVIGAGAHYPRTGGGGSSLVVPIHVVSPLAALQKRLAGKNVRIEYSVGAVMEGDETTLQTFWHRVMNFIKGQTDLQQAVELASRADVAVVFAGLSNFYESEGGDREFFGLPEGQDELIREVSRVNSNTIVVINAGNPVAMPWLEQVPGVIYAWYGGQEAGYAVADALLGKLNPSGKLPVSFPKRWEDAAAFGAYPQDPGSEDQVTYKEGIYVGYRHFDTHQIEPLFPFGHGLSYSQFSYSHLKLDRHLVVASSPEVQVSFDVTNTGDIAGAEAAQVYVSEFAPPVDRPMQELKGFEKVYLLPGETKRVSLSLNSASFAYYDATEIDPSARGWRVPSDLFTVRVGSSSRDIRLKGHLLIAPMKQLH